MMTFIELIQATMFLAGKFALAVFSAVIVPLGIWISFREKWKISIIAKKLGALLLSFAIVTGFFVTVGSLGHKAEADQWGRKAEAMER
ncbi:MAG: hypothetical protein WB502_06735 [Thermoactinomyces sp.]